MNVAATDLSQIISMKYTIPMTPPLIRLPELKAWLILLEFENSKKLKSNLININKWLQLSENQILYDDISEYKYAYDDSWFFLCLLRIFTCNICVALFLINIRLQTTFRIKVENVTHGPIHIQNFICILNSLITKSYFNFPI